MVKDILFAISTGAEPTSEVYESVGLFEMVDEASRRGDLKRMKYIANSAVSCYVTSYGHSRNDTIVYESLKKLRNDIDMYEEEAARESSVTHAGAGTEKRVCPACTYINDVGETCEVCKSPLLGGRRSRKTRRSRRSRRISRSRRSRRISRRRRSRRSRR